MSKTFLPAYVFRYTTRTTEAFQFARNSPGSRYSIDVQNSAPPFDERCVQAWASNAGDKLCFENGSASAIVSIIYDDVLVHIEKLRSSQVIETFVPA